MSSTFQNTPKAAEYAERIDKLFGEISFNQLYQSTFVDMAFDECFNQNVKLEALLSAAKDKLAASHELILVNLQDSVNLLLERVKELEAIHA